MSKDQTEYFTSKDRENTGQMCLSSSDAADSASALPQAVASEVVRGKAVCAKCRGDILDRYLLKVNDLCWHAQCLSCNACQTQLSEHTSCYIRDKLIFCKRDYFRRYRTWCSCCGETVRSTDWVRRAKGNVYHLACFSCFSCRRQLSTGEQFALVGHKVLCRVHYDCVLDKCKAAIAKGKTVCLDGALETGCELNQKPSKRARTSFTSDQLQIMQTQFAQDNNPDAQTLQKLSDLTGLSRRVIQVWFQNCRARHKKHISPQNSAPPVGGSGLQVGHVSQPTLTYTTGLFSSLHSCLNVHTPSSQLHQPLMSHRSTHRPISSS